ncbi:hypothetical protein BCV69DRAFT_3359 [Microstroma glucosiphilum]|uniref:Uncharacterized protein n=1 Tax=Pseudomicrostroma glucosiphilum TaxID=1684307 RepID=A0A316UGW4_9BASI|nr:hypothetical protein BCV69DRAFT_3359 [Pseudomicrostroma glucosiphilum]PWN23571.1 hypothetical protein BCV69DRAFT_3359 [Pseudomicrostroma glucosiphilum]
MADLRPCPTIMSVRTSACRSVSCRAINLPVSPAGECTLDHHIAFVAAYLASHARDTTGRGGGQLTLVGITSVDLELSHGEEPVSRCLCHRSRRTTLVVSRRTRRALASARRSGPREITKAGSRHHRWCCPEWTRSENQRATAREARAGARHLSHPSCFHVCHLTVTILF